MPDTSHPVEASPAREMAVSMKFFALYFSSRLTTVKSTSRAGLERAYSPTRRNTEKLTYTTSPGHRAMPRNPIRLTTGRNRSEATRPYRATTRFVMNNCVSQVSTFVAKSSVEKRRVLASGVSKCSATSRTCSKYRNVAVMVRKVR